MFFFYLLSMYIALESRDVYWYSTQLLLKVSCIPVSGQQNFILVKIDRYINFQCLNFESCLQI